MVYFYLKNSFILFYLFFLTELDLHCCARAFSICSERELLSRAAQALEHGFSSRGARP